jgi:hypothetical protein
LNPGGRTLALISFRRSGCSIFLGNSLPRPSAGPVCAPKKRQGMNRDSWLTVEQAEILAEDLALLVAELESDITRLVNSEYERLTKHLLPTVPKR